MWVWSNSTERRTTTHIVLPCKRYTRMTVYFKVTQFIYSPDKVRAPVCGKIDSETMDRRCCSSWAER